MDAFFTLLGGTVIFFMFIVAPPIILYDAYFSYNAKRRRSPKMWDLSEVAFYKDMTKEEFLKTYPLYPNGNFDSGFIIDFENEKSYKVLRIMAITNSGFRAIAFNRRQMVKNLQNFS